MIGFRSSGSMSDANKYSNKTTVKHGLMYRWTDTSLPDHLRARSRGDARRGAKDFFLCVSVFRYAAAVASREMALPRPAEPPRVVLKRARTADARAAYRGARRVSARLVQKKVRPRFAELKTINRWNRSSRRRAWSSRPGPNAAPLSRSPPCPPDDTRESSDERLTHSLTHLKNET